jgi:CYTH domain-containing protein
MAIEIERKFLVNRGKWNATVKKHGKLYNQGYISTDPDKTIRVRLTETAGFLTIKGLSIGASRPEFEYEIPAEDAKELLEKFCPTVVAKTRHEISYNGKLWEADEFLGENEGLIVAEIELKDEQETFDLPAWIDREVTGEEKYYNSSLSNKPFKKW